MELKSGNTGRFKAFSNDLVFKLGGGFMGDFYYYTLYLTNTAYFYIRCYIITNIFCNFIKLCEKRYTVF